MDDTSEGKCPFGYGSENADGENVDPGYKHTAVAPALSRDKLPDLVKTTIEPGAGGAATGRCLCQAVSYRVKKPVEKIFANHDQSSRRWTGGIALTLMIRATDMEFCGWGNIVHFANSARETHCFCRLCGSSIFVRHLQPEAMNGMLSLSVGTLDSVDGMRLTAETYIDCKPDIYTFEGERRVMTEQEVESMYQPRTAAE